MSYMVAKYIWSPGSIALEHQRANNTSDAEYAEKLAHKYLGTGIEILTVGNFDVHAEYKPVRYVNTREDFEREIEEMLLKETESNNFNELVRRVADKNDEALRKLTNYEQENNDIQ